MSTKVEKAALKQFEKRQTKSGSFEYQLVCQQCGKTRWLPQWKMFRRCDGHVRQFCSVQCVGKSFRNQVTAVCSVCKQSFQFQPSRSKSYCSRKCAAIDLKEVRAAGVRAAIKRRSKKEQARINAKVSQTKKARLRTDVEYKQRLIESGKGLTKFRTVDSYRKAVLTKQARYTKRRWSELIKAGLPEVRKDPWNKGLSKKTDSRIAAAAAKLIGHQPAKGAGSGKGGYRKDLGIYVRSTWEADFARLLTLLELDWRYEPRVFKLRNRHGKVIDSYRPDFYIPALRLWVEVSGYVSEKKQRRLALFALQYPKKSLLHITVEVYLGLRKMFGHCFKWEGSPINNISPNASVFYEALDREVQ